MTRFAEEFAKHGASSFARQLAFGDFLGQHNWAVDIHTGTVDFGGGRRYSIQLLGTEAHISGEWLWAWANEASQLPGHVLGACEAIRRFGDQHGIRELVEPFFPLAFANGHQLALLSAGLLTDCCYYRGPYEGGAVFFLVMGAPAEALAPVQPERAITVIGEVTMQFDVAHRQIVQSFFQDQRLAIESSENAISAIWANGSAITVSFDRHGRIAEMKAAMNPRSE